MIWGLGLHGCRVAGVGLGFRTLHLKGLGLNVLGA